MPYAEPDLPKGKIPIIVERGAADIISSIKLKSLAGCCVIYFKPSNFKIIANSF